MSGYGEAGVDRALAPQSEGWGVRALEFTFPDFDDDPSDTPQMTKDVTAMQPVQPTALTSTIQSVMPSRFASRLQIIMSGDQDIAEDDYSRGAEL